MSMFKEEETFGQLLQPDQSVKEEHRRDATVMLVESIWIRQQRKTNLF